MTLEISPVLAGTFDAQDYVPPHNVASTQVDDSDATDSRRYTKFDRSATEAGSTTTFSFSDFIDAINPLQHIPVVSSIYREITGDTINPVSRVVGDILYGGVLGVASAVIGGVGAAGDSVIEAETGKDSTGNVLAALFENNQSVSPDPATQLAQANTASPGIAQTAAQPPAQTTIKTAAQINARAKLQAAATVAAVSSSTAASMPSLGQTPNLSLGGSPGNSAAQMANMMASIAPPNAGSPNGNSPAGMLPLNVQKTFAINPNKLPYGGVMDPTTLQGTNMAVSLANSAPGLQMNHMVYMGRQLNGIRPSPLAAATSAPVGASSAPSYTSTAAPDALPPGLMDDIAALRAVNKYKSTASQTAPAGTTMDVVN